MPAEHLSQSETSITDRLAAGRHYMDLARIELSYVPQAADAVEQLDDLIADADEAMDVLAKRPEAF